MELTALHTTVATFSGQPTAPPPPPIPDELAIDPIEAALFRVAESLSMSPAALRPALARVSSGRSP